MSGLTPQAEATAQLAALWLQIDAAARALRGDVGMEMLRRTSWNTVIAGRPVTVRLALEMVQTGPTAAPAPEPAPEPPRAA